MNMTMKRCRFLGRKIGDSNKPGGFWLLYNLPALEFVVAFELCQRQPCTRHVHLSRMTFVDAFVQRLSCGTHLSLLLAHTDCATPPASCL